MTNYQHFGEAQQGKCPLHENVEERHEQEVKRAADEAMAKVRADNPGLSDADLMIQVSDRVKQAENARRGVAAQDANAFPFQMVGDVLRHRNGHPPMPMAGGQPVGPIAPAIPLPPVPNMQPIQQYVPQPPFNYPIAPVQAPFYARHAQPAPAINYLAPGLQPPPYQFGNQYNPYPLQFACPRCFQNHPPNQHC